MAAVIWRAVELLLLWLAVSCALGAAWIFACEITRFISSQARKVRAGVSERDERAVPAISDSPGSGTALHDGEA